MSSVRLALRVLRVDGRTRTSAILTGLGVAVATALVLLLVGLPFATEARGERSMWQEPSYSSGEDGPATLLLTSSEDYADGSKVERVDVAPLTDPRAIDLPPGIDRLPGPGETLLSPELARLVDGTPGSQLGDRFGEVVGVLGEDALQYPDQLVALVGHTPQTITPGALRQDGFAVGGAEQDPLLQLLAGVGVVVLLVPSLVLVASAARLTAARRERRLAALRLAGATPRQVVEMVAAETAIAAVGGAAIGFAVSPVLHSLAAHVPWNGGTWQPGDFTLPLAVSLPITVAMPVLVLLAAVLALRRVVSTPLGAAGSHARKPLHWWRLLALPLAGLAFTLAVTADEPTMMTVLGGLLLIVASAALVGPWVTSAVGGIFVRIWRRPAMLLAGRRLRDDPRGAYRASAGVVLAVFTGSMALTLLPTFESMAGSSSPYRDSVLYVPGLDAAEARQIAERADADLARYGQRERTAQVGEVYLSRGPDSGESAMVLDCASAGTLLRLDMDGACAGQPGVYAEYPMNLNGVHVSAIWNEPGPALAADTPVRPIRATDADVSSVPVIDPAVLPSGFEPQAVTVAVAATEANREVVRTALAGAAGGVQVESREMRLADQQTQLEDLRRVTVIGLIAAGALSGCSAAIATAGSVMDRRRTFGALLAAGTPVRVLARALRTEAAMPAMVATVGAGAVGVLVGMGLFSLVDDGSVVLSPWILAPVVLGVGVALLAASVCRPALNRVRAEPLADE
ncbi:FtsX-like permease family protein [Prauserella muralis]|uniref:Permease n=1 Tax=Prauserella muralis TaxID=588067 RepID=A0A2V4B8M4_9PSEU|nr:FtsX-like permease family protein [Prauserella muralis]PXY31607.1 permease [Prauserella muralis]TWE14030.1 FtsX-like permease family protein [Prauserella muralis]